MKIQLIDLELFYPIVEEWCKGNNFPIVDSGLLSDKVFVCFNDKEKPTHCISVYFTNSGICWIGFPITNPKIDIVEKKECLNYLLQSLVFMINEMGYRYIFTTSKTKTIEDKLQTLGFHIGDSNVNHYILKLNN